MSAVTVPTRFDAIKSLFDEAHFVSPAHIVLYDEVLADPRVQALLTDVTGVDAKVPGLAKIGKEILSDRKKRVWVPGLIACALTSAPREEQLTLEV